MVSGTFKDFRIRTVAGDHSFDVEDSALRALERVFKNEAQDDRVRQAAVNAARNLTATIEQVRSEGQ